MPTVALIPAGTPCSRGSSCRRYLNGSPRQAVLTVDGAAHCAPDALEVGWFPWAATASTTRGVFAVSGQAPADLATWKANPVQSDFVNSTSTLYDVGALVTMSDGSTWWVQIRDTGARLRNATTRAAVIQALRDGATMLRARHGAGTVSSWTTYRRVVA